MGSPVHVARVALGVTVTIPEEVVETQVGYVPWLLGDSLAAQVQEQCRADGLGYYPALDYFRGRSGSVDPDLLILIDEVALFCTNYARREFRRRLARVFSNVVVQQAQCSAYTLPRVRPGQANALAELGRHYAPDSVRLDLLLSSIERETTPELVQLAVSKVTHWTRDPFSGFAVTQARLLDVS